MVHTKPRSRGRLSDCPENYLQTPKKKNKSRNLGQIVPHPIFGPPKRHPPRNIN